MNKNEGENIMTVENWKIRDDWAEINSRIYNPNIRFEELHKTLLYELQCLSIKCRIYTTGNNPVTYIQPDWRCGRGKYRDNFLNLTHYVHGGITFEGSLPDAEGYWVGWDYAQAGDYMALMPFPENHKWSIQELIIEACEACEWIIDGRNKRNWRQAFDFL